MKSTLAIILLLAGALTLGACKTSEPGVTNKMGTITATLAADTTAATAAAKNAAEDLKLQDIVATSTALDGSVRANTAQGDKVQVLINSAGQGVSTVRISVGDWGDEAVSLRILDRIKANLADK